MRVRNATYMQFIANKPFVGLLKSKHAPQFRKNTACAKTAQRMSANAM